MATFIVNVEESFIPAFQEFIKNSKDKIFVEKERFYTLEDLQKKFPNNDLTKKTKRGIRKRSSTRMWAFINNYRLYTSPLKANLNLQ